MHRCRGAAKRSAWYDDDDGTPNYNPFRKTRSHSRTLAEQDEENARLHTNYSETFIMTLTQRNRQSQNANQFQVPKHADTMPTQPTKSPAESSGLRDVTCDREGHDNRESTEKSQGSGGENSEITKVETNSQPAAIPETEPTDAKPRRRKMHIPFMGKKDDGNPDASQPKKKRSLFKKSKDGQKFTARSQLRATLLNSYVNVLLVFVPVGIAVNYTGISRVAVFVINFIAIIPLAGMLSYATEEIALRTGETIGGLLNATFGNAVELIVSIIALVGNQVDIVQESLIGSILSNLLLVMGMCFFFGGISRIKQNFNKTVAQTASSLLALAVGSLIIPAAFQAWAVGTQDAKDAEITSLSRGTAILLLIVYGCYLLFQLKTHASIYNTPSEKTEKRSKKVASGEASKGIANVGAGMSASIGGPAALTSPVESPDKEDEDEGEQPQLSKWVALITLAISTAFVALCAEYMVDSIDAITKGGGVSRTFVGLILLPIVGNAAEHATAVTVACKDKMDLAIGVAVGSSMQIALLVIPFVVVLGWILNNDNMNLAFDSFQIAILFVAVLLVNYLISDGESHWLEGVLLMTLYVIIAIAAWFYPKHDPSNMDARSLGALREPFRS